MLRSDLHDYSDAYIVVKGKIIVTNLDNMHMIKNELLKTMHHLFAVFQKLIIFLLMI